jgi:carbon storage regulator CsrA
MLVFGRKKSEAIRFGPDTDEFVRVEVVEIQRSPVSLSSKSPRHMRGVRAEIADSYHKRVKNPALVSSQASDRSEAEGVTEHSPLGGAAPANETVASRHRLVMSRAHKMAILFGEARLTLIAITGDQVRLGIEAPENWLAYREEVFKAVDGSVAAPAPTGRQPQRLQSTAVAEILSRAGCLQAPEELEELTAGLLSLRAKRLAPVVSDEEMRLPISINEGVPVELTDRVGSLIQKQDDCSLTVEESRELLQLAEEVERRGVERLEALSNLAELRGVSLRVLIQSLGVAAGDHG